MATTKDYRLGEFTFPRGWFMIADADELNTHKPLAVRFFGKDFALYRGRETGKVVLLKASMRIRSHEFANEKTVSVTFLRIRSRYSLISCCLQRLVTPPQLPSLYPIINEADNEESDETSQ